MSTELGWDQKYNKDNKLVVDSTTRNNRISICKDCSSLKAYFCKECNCYMPMKTWIPLAVCPLNKW